MIKEWKIPWMFDNTDIPLFLKKHIFSFMRMNILGICYKFDPFFLFIRQLKIYFLLSFLLCVIPR